jgi:hypothetical protein
LSAHGLDGEPAGQRGSTSVVLLVGAVGCAELGDLPAGATSPVPAVPELVAVAVEGTASPVVPQRPVVGEWQPSWSGAEHVMIVDLERNDLARVAVTGSVEVESLYEVSEWAGLWHAGSTVAAELLPGVGVLDVLRVVLPGGSVTGAPKWAACRLLAELEPVGRGPAMGAFGVIRPGGLDLGLTIRTVGVDEDRVHLWAGGGITWGSDPDDEVAEADAKAGPVMRALA